MTVVLLAVIAAGVWIMAAESIIFAAIRLRDHFRRLRAAAALLREQDAARLLEEARTRQGVTVTGHGTGEWE